MSNQEYRTFVSPFAATQDIVIALRSAAQASTWPAPQHANDTLYALAADEIERLRAVVDDARSGYYPS